VAGETRRQRRDARRVAGDGASRDQKSTPVPSGDGTAAVAVGPADTRRRGGFIRESWAELLKVDWPTRAQTIQGTVVVVIACFIVGAYLWGLDQVLQPFVRDVLLGWGQ
jgi:preprotein translocase SecE subunit